MYPSMRDLAETQRLAQEYASYSQSRNGLGNVLGGVAGLLVYLTGVLLGPGLPTAIITIGLTIAWLIGKEVIRRRVYRTFGDARERWSPVQRRLHIGLTAFVALVALGIWGLFLVKGQVGNPRGWPYLAFIAAMPFITWLYLRTPYEFIIGVFLVCASAVTSAGGAYGLSAWYAWFVPICAALMLVLGVQEHRRYAALTAQLRGRQEAADARR